MKFHTYDKTMVMYRGYNKTFKAKLLNIIITIYNVSF